MPSIRESLKSPGTGMRLPDNKDTVTPILALQFYFVSSQEAVPSASPMGTPKHSLKKMTSTEDPKGTHSEGLFLMPPAGTSLGSLKSECVSSTSIKQQGRQATPSVSQVSSSPGKRGERSCVMQGGRFVRLLQEPQGRCILCKQMPTKWQHVFSDNLMVILLKQA